MYDVVVIGGNLAGVNAAIKAAKKGVKVALIEKNKHPHNPAHCGEGLLETFGDLLGIFQLECSKNRINKTIRNVGSPKESIFKMKKYNLIIFDRNYVENALLKQAEESGVKLFLGKKMKDFKPPHKVILDDNKTIEGKIIIDSSGIACVVGQKVGLKTKLKKQDIGVCIQSRVIGNFDSNSVRIWFHKPYSPFGYGWIFPLNEKSANIGLGIRGGQKYDLDELLKKFIKDMTGDKYKVTSTFRACVPITTPINPIYKDNVIITGDAARLADSVGAAGIRNAVLSGNLAGRVAADYINGKISSLKIYQDTISCITDKLKKMYDRQNYVYSDETRFLKRYRRGIKILNIIDKILPTFVENSIAKGLFKDIKIIESYR